MVNHPLANKCMGYILPTTWGPPPHPLPYEHLEAPPPYQIDLFQLVHLPLLLTDVTENITLVQTTYADGNKIEIVGL